MAISQSTWLKGLNPVVTLGALLVIAGVMLGLLMYQEQAASLFDQVRSGITYAFSWYYVLIAALFLFFNGWLAFSRFGRIRLGRDDERPEFGYFSWFAMVFSAGQGIGLIFWSIAEPMFHMQGNPFSTTAMSAEAAESAMRITFFHWGLHAWSIYCVVALALAYAAFRKGLPLTIRSTLRPLFGRVMDGPWGHAVDILAILATIFGVATSLGLGAQQINAGLSRLLGLESSVLVQLGLIAVITVVAVLSAVSGVNRGVKLLSELNIILTIALILFFFIWGPSRYLIMSLVDATGDYLANVIEMSFWTDASKQDPAAWEGWKSSWQGWWTVFYWGWWLSWAPFVGVFIARVSRGRTIREFILGVILVPTVLTFIWIAAFGGTAVSHELFGEAGISAAVTKDVASAFFVTVDSMNLGGLGTVALWLGTLLVATYFITSADSATLVLTTIMSHGAIHPAKRHRVFWGGMQGVVAAVLLVVGGAASLATLQTAAIASALPFSFIMLLMCLSLIKALHAEAPVELVAVRSETPAAI
ncbi:BCCT family transporter [Pseudomonas sp.]|uniref:BCCT family transporter n=1 Tax=Pseudomonas sp. TaxID=306 RepID=UPI0027302679|nr:BCCT family transporter [Pseudomonas sp.]MDP2242981.1 BCCT family transporter [Pseudomonas sp.]